MPNLRKHHALHGRSHAQLLWHLSFIAYATTDKFELVKLYPETNAEVCFQIKGHGVIYYYCNKHGLFGKRV